MAGNSEKKESKKKGNERSRNLYYILFINVFVLISYLYAIYFNSYEIEKFDITSIVVLNVIMIRVRFHYDFNQMLL